MRTCACLWPFRRGGLAADCCFWSGYKSGCVPFAPLSPGCLLFSLSPTHCVSLCNTRLMKACSLRHASLFHHTPLLLFFTFPSFFLSSLQTAHDWDKPTAGPYSRQESGAMWHYALTSCLKNLPQSRRPPNIIHKVCTQVNLHIRDLCVESKIQLLLSVYTGL